MQHPAGSFHHLRKQPCSGNALRLTGIAMILVLAAHAVTARADGDGTAEMARRLASIHAAKRPLFNNYLSAERVPLYQQKFEQTTDPAQKVTALWDLANEQLNAGLSEEALQSFLKVGELATRHAPDFLRTNQRLLWHMQGLSHLRIGEQENCLHHHSHESCIFPLAGGGIHQLTRGSRGAVSVFEKLLQKYPDDVGSRWLLNVAYMTLGQYPDAVPESMLIDPSRFESPVSIGRFEDVAGALGIDQDGLCGGSVMEDFNNDGLLDLMVSDWSLDAPVTVFLNTGDGSFRKLSEAESGLEGITGGLNMIHADYDNDGLVDVLVLRGAWRNAEGRMPNSLLRNLGNGRFADVTISAGLYSARPTQAATWFDYNADGHIDLFIANETADRRRRNPCELFRNNGDGTFTECARIMNLDLMGYFKGVTSGDYNNDGRPDLYLSNLQGDNVLLRNDGPALRGGRPDGPWKFTDVTRMAGVADPPNSFPTWFFDYDNDGFPDIFVCGYTLNFVDDVAADYLGIPNNTVKPILYRNRGDGTFENVTRRAGLDHAALAMGCNFGDLNNDGFLDFYLGTGNPQLSTLIPNRMFLNVRGQTFAEITTSGGFGHLQKGHGISFGDIDNDGDQDVHATMGGAVSGDNYRNVLFRNPGQKANWIKLKLTGQDSNRAAIGARVTMTVSSADGLRSIYRTVGSGGSFGANPFRLEVGLGEAEEVRSVRIDWPATGKSQSFENLKANRAWHIIEDRESIAPLELKTITLPDPGSTGHPHHGNHSHAE